MDVRNMHKYENLEMSSLEALQKKDNEKIKELVREMEELEKSPPQPYKQNIPEPRHRERLLGFHKSYSEEKNRDLIQYLMGKTLFPHYCLSYYPDTLREPVFKPRNGFPPVYRREDFFNFGLTGLLRVWKGTLMFMGWYNYVVTDLKTIKEAAVQEFRSGHDMVTDLWGLVDNDLKTPEDGDEWHPAEMERHRQSVTRINGMETFRSALDANVDFMLSVKLRDDTAAALKRAITPDAKPLCQIPFGLGGYSPVLERYYQYDHAAAPAIDLGKKPLKMFSICGGIYGLKNGLILDAADGTASGTRTMLAGFLEQAGKEGLLRGKDGEYLNYLSNEGNRFEQCCTG